uniref:Uncharacterized protein n=1 Tax=Equus caballus TaxID=9796 RepID=A0A9L0R679_HORSE
MNIGTQISLQNLAFNSLGCTCRSGIAGSNGNSIFNFLRNHGAVFYSSCTILHSHQWYTGVPISLHLRQHLLFFGSFFSFIVAIMVVLICISLMISDAEHLFVGFLAICISSLEKCLFKSVLVRAPQRNRIIGGCVWREREREILRNWLTQL